MTGESVYNENKLVCSSNENNIDKNTILELERNNVKNNYDNYKVVYVEIPEYETVGENSIVVEGFPNLDENVDTIYIEVEQNENTASFHELTTLQKDSFVINETDSLALEKNVPAPEPCKTVYADDSKKTSHCVKKPSNLKTPPQKIFKQAAIVARPRSKLKEPFPSEKPKKLTQLLDSSKDGSKSEDLLWLLNFKLDEYIKNPGLDDVSDASFSLNDAKKNEGSQNSAKKRSSDIKEEPNEEVKKKPPFTYTELIECALQEKGPLTVSEIYQWISEMFPYYKAWDDRWKNSVRHNLSINPYFRKGSKAKQGSGHLWTVSKCAENTKSWTAKRQRYQEFEAYTKRIKIEKAMKMETEALEMDAAQEAELAASIIENKENRGVQKDYQLPLLNSAYEQSAGEILSGVKRNVAVEYIEPTKDTNSNDFLNPVSKEVLMGECGFLNQIELNLTAESTEHMEAVDSEVFDHLEDLGFQFTDVTSQCTSQLMSLVN